MKSLDYLAQMVPEKTTTLKLLLGLIFPTEGRAFVLGKTTNDVAVKNRIGFLPEESCFYRFLKCR